MDAQAPNQAAAQWLSAGGLGGWRTSSRRSPWETPGLTSPSKKEGRRCYLEVKGVTLEENGVAKFPDRPHQPGDKASQGPDPGGSPGYGAYVLFVIQLQPVAYFTPNDGTDPAFGQALRAAKAAGVALLAMDCRVTPWSMAIGQPVEVRL